MARLHLWLIGVFIFLMPIASLAADPKPGSILPATKMRVTGSKLNVQWSIMPLPNEPVTLKIFKAGSAAVVGRATISPGTQPVNGSTPIAGAVGDQFDVQLSGPSGALASVRLSSDPNAGTAPKSDGNTKKFSNTIFGPDPLTSAEYLSKLYVWAVSLGILAASISIIRAGYIYTAGRGNPSSISSAKEIIVNALVGLALLVLSYTILRFLLGSRIQPAQTTFTTIVQAK